MSNYFKFFPTTDHDIQSNGQTVALTNILRRFVVRPSIKDNLKVYHEYDVQAGDRPDTIAAKYYGSSGYSWLVMLFNEVNDPLFDWPLFNTDFDNYIKGKYGSTSIAKATVHEYRRILNEAQRKNDGTLVPKRWIVVDSTTYSSLSEINRESISKYDWELEEQEAKRKIKLLDKSYLPLIRNEVKFIVRNGV